MFVAVTGFTGRRFNETSILLGWIAGNGTTAYILEQANSTGTFLASYNLTTSNSYLVTGVPSGVLFTFTLYAGNSIGIDFTEGVTTQASTFSIQHLSFRFLP